MEENDPSDKRGVNGLFSGNAILMGASRYRLAVHETGDVSEWVAHRNGRPNLIAKKNVRRPFGMTFSNVGQLAQAA